MMRIILSRKGFDSSFGGCPSPLLDGSPLSLPIPTRQPTLTKYENLRQPIPGLVSDLTRGRLTGEHNCHLDPDLDPLVLPTRAPGWRGALGQVAQAQKHLSNQGVGPGDLFLFWGLFRPVRRQHGVWRYFGKPVHSVFGWLQVQEAIPNPGGGPLAYHPWLSQHPHTQQGWGDQNTIYIAHEALTGPFGGTSPGYGLFRTAFQLTAPDAPSPSIWEVPEWLHPLSAGTGMTYHPPSRWLEGRRLRSAARGQEFVANVSLRPDALEWAIWLIDAHR